ncbi:MAG: histidine kinase [Bacteroidota bacterium]
MRRMLEAADKQKEIYKQLTDWQLLSFSSPAAFFTMAVIMYIILYWKYKKLITWKLISLLLTGVFSGIFFRAFLEEYILAILTGKGNYHPETTWVQYINDNLYYSIVFCSLGIVFYFVELSNNNEKKKKDFAILQRETEIKFLRSQINPHFLFNTLNNVYSLVNRNSPSALPAIEKLSTLLRYSLYEQKKSVSLNQEMEYLRQLVELESMRIEGLAPIAWDVGSNLTEWQVPPLLLVPFVENAFKHGDLQDQSQPLVIRLQMDGNRKLVFQVINRIKPGQKSKDGTGGIGLVNVQKRLHLLYPEAHQLSIKNHSDLFEVNLELYTTIPNHQK